MMKDKVVVAGVKLKILKANHNRCVLLIVSIYVVVAGVKLKILKANHNNYRLRNNESCLRKDRRICIFHPFLEGQDYRI